MHKKGFTLIELLVVISIISLLTSIIFSATSISRSKARDAVKAQQVKHVHTAINGYFNEKGLMPGNYLNYNGTTNSSGTGNTLACEDSSDGGSAYTTSMNVLVSNGFLSSIPLSPTSNRKYCYFNNGSQNEQGGVFIATLENTTLKSSCPAFAIYTGTGLSFSPNNSAPFQNATQYYNYYCTSGGPLPLTCSSFISVCGTGMTCSCSPY